MKFNKKLGGLLAIVAIILSVGLIALSKRAVPVRLSPTTTFIDRPLADDGLPNFSLAIVNKYREGVANENNGARLFWEAVGPGDMRPAEFDALCDDLDVSIDPTGPFLVDVAGDEMVSQLEEWLAEQGAIDVSDDSPAESTVRAPIDGVANFKTRPWTDEQFPPLAAWVAENQRPLDLLVEASKKPKLFSPPPNALLDQRTPVISLLLPTAQQMRGAVRSLSARAMNRLANREYAEAWQDVFACWRFGQAIGQGPTLVEVLVGVAVRSVAMNATLAILDSPSLPKDLARIILADLESLDSQLPLADPLDFAERLCLLDSALRMTTGRLRGMDDPALPANLNVTAIDSNIPLEMINDQCDRIVDVVSNGDWQIRKREINRLYQDLGVMSQAQPWERLQAFADRTKRSEMAGAIILNHMIPAIKAVVEAHERDQTNLALARIAAALALYRADHGDYPATLIELTETRVVKELPNDPFTSATFRYERRADGYLLYSLFANRKDDGGTDLTHPIVNGDWTRDETASRPGMDASDLVIRLPLPPLELPFQPAPQGAKP